MTIIIGFVITVGCILGGFMAMGGHVDVLVQPFELMIIGGAGVGGNLAGSVIVQLVHQGGVVGGRAVVAVK